MKYDINSAKITISVRELVWTAFPHGDLGSYSSEAPNNAALGIKIHKKLERENKSGENYFSEVSLSHTCLFNDICYEVNGRADGIIKSADGSITVEEIKTVRSFCFGAPPHHDLAQLRCYAYFICSSKNLGAVKLRLTYYNTETKKIKYFTEEASLENLRTFYIGLIAKCERFGLIEKEKMTVRLPSISDVYFPFENCRDGQKEMISSVFKAIKNEKRLFVQAPTGTGKTISSLYPALKAVGEGLCDKIFYLTAKASAAKAADDAIKQISEGGAKIKYIVISAKENVCFDCGEHVSSFISKCTPENCPFAEKYYEKVYDAIYELLSSYDGFNSEIIASAARKYGVCPYELSLDLSLYCDVIICDYNYLFDPKVYFRRYFENPSERYVFLIDEAHNLADRARSMYSAELSVGMFEKLSSLTRGDKMLGEASEKLAKSMLALKKLFRDEIVTDENGSESGFYISREPLIIINEQIREFEIKLEKWLFIHKNFDERYENQKKHVTDVYYAVKEYLRISEYYDERFITYITLAEGELVCKLFCLDPSHVLDLRMRKAVSAILFSATLTPIEYFSDVLGGGKGARYLSLPSPFDKSNLCLCAIDTVSTKFAERDANIAEIAELIAAAVCGRKGNYIVYFPSYAYMNKVYSLFTKLYPKTRTAIQRSGGVSAREFLMNFKEGGNELFIGFCVLGGVFSEGIDLPGDRLIGAVVVGVGLPQISNELNIIRDYYQNVYEKGYEYAYVYPGMNKILQATGRVIRKETDRGIVVLIDDRYAAEEYKHLFPEHWSELKYAGNAHSLAILAERFWEKSEKAPQNEENQK